MQNTLHDYKSNNDYIVIWRFSVFNIKQNSVISNSQSISITKIYQRFYITAKSFFQQLNFGHNSPTHITIQLV